MRATKIQIAKYAKLSTARDSAIDAVYRCAPDNKTKFNDCLAMAPIETVRAYDAARDALAAYEQKMIHQGRAWIDNLGGFNLPRA